MLLLLLSLLVGAASGRTCTDQVRYVGPVFDAPKCSPAGVRDPTSATGPDGDWRMATGCGAPLAGPQPPAAGTKIGTMMEHTDLPAGAYMRRHWRHQATDRDARLAPTTTFSCVFRVMPTIKTDDQSAPDGAVGTWTLAVNKSDIVHDPAAPAATRSSKPDACAMWRPAGVKKARGVVLSASLIPEQFWQDGSTFRKAVEQAQMVAIILNCSVAKIHNVSSCAVEARPCNTSMACTASPCTRCVGHKCVDKHQQQIRLSEDFYVPKVLTAFAEASGMPEISSAPIFAMGWSAAGPFAMHVAYALPTQTLGFLYYHSGTMTCPTHFAKAPGCMKNETFSRIPFLAINGECEQYGPGENPPVPTHMCQWMPPREMQWKAVRESVELYRRNAGLVQLFVTEMTNHTHCKPEEVQYAAAYLTKAASYRISKDGGALLHIQEETGWLTDMNFKPNETHVRRHATAAFDAYSGNKTEAAWHFDEELARAYEAAESGLWDPKRDNGAFWEYCKEPPKCNGFPCCPPSPPNSLNWHRGDDNFTVSISNHNKLLTYTQQPVRLQANLRHCHDQDIKVINITSNAAAVPSQMDERGHVWISTSIAPGQEQTYSVSCGGVNAPPKTTGPSVTKKQGMYVLSNSETTLAVPAVATGSIPPPPFQGMSSVTRDKLLGSSSWNTSLALASFTASVEANGPVFARVRLLYTFKPGFDTFNISFTLGPADKYAIVDESYSAGRRDSNDAWSLHLSAGIKASHALVQATHQCDYSDRFAVVTGGDAKNLTSVSLVPNQRYGNSLGYFFYRWNQGCDSKAIVGSADSLGTGLAAVAIRGGKWVWPGGTGFSFSELGASLATLTVAATGDYLGLRLPTYVPATSHAVAGRRVFLLCPYYTAVEAQQLPTYQQLAGFQPLDKLVNEYVLEWDGIVAANETAVFPYFLGPGTNPTGGLRGQARSLNKNILSGKTPTPSLSALVTVNSMFDPDWYGLYRGFVSPENNNFATDFMRPAILTAVAMVADNGSSVLQLEQSDQPKHPKHPHPPPQKHPLWQRFVTLVQQAFQMDIFHSITMPSGATQEAPGYLGHAMDAWLSDAAIYRQYFGFDPLKDPRLVQAVSFQFQMGHPFNFHMLGPAAADPSKWANRYITPIGDTHPNSVNFTKLVGLFSNFSALDPSTLSSLDLAGFGSVLRSQPGTVNETFLSFKAGPNQGHDHGDQLSIHWCAYGARHAIDLMFGYKPRPLQEYWHNRMSFGLSGQLQNMDGYARMVASKYNAAFDVAVGMVSSRRLRTPPLAPPGIWAADYAYTTLTRALNYTRTSVLMKQSPGRDYVVLRDVFESPRAVNYVLNQFYMQDGTEVATLTNQTASTATVDLGNSTLFVLAIDPAAKLATPAFFSKVRWTNVSEGGEFATGVRLNFSAALSSDVVAVLYPAGSLSKAVIPTVTCSSTGEMSVAFSAQADKFIFTHNGITVTRGGSTTPILKSTDLNLTKSQGDVGLTTLDSGYDFGIIPDWLVEQRTRNPVYTWPLNPSFSAVPEAKPAPTGKQAAPRLKLDDAKPPKPQPPQDQPTDIPVHFSSYLSTGSNASSVQVLSGGIVAVAGFFPSSDNFSLQPTVLLNVQHGTTGGVIFMKADAEGSKVLALTRIGERVDDISCKEVQDETLCAVVGAHGAATIKVDTTTCATTLVWSADLPVYTGERFPTKYYVNYSYSVCSGWIYNWDYGFHPDGFKPHFCHTDIGTDGTVVVSASGHHGYAEHQNCSVRGAPDGTKQCQINFWPVLLFGAKGEVLVNVTINNRIVYDVAIDADSKTFFVAGYNQSIEHTDKYKSVVQIGFLDALDFSGQPKWSAWGFDQDQIGGLLADTRIMHVTSSESSVYITGWTSGGDTIFSCDPQNVSSQQNTAVKIDEFASLGGISAQVALYVAQLEIVSGKKLHEQYMHAQSPPDEAYKHVGANPRKNSTMGSMISGLGNSLAVGSEGQIYVSGFTDCCVAYRENGTVGGKAPGKYLQQPQDAYLPNQAESFVLELNADMSSRTTWNSWMQKGVSTMAAVHTSKSLAAAVGNVQPDSSATIVNSFSQHSMDRTQPAAIVTAWPVGTIATDEAIRVRGLKTDELLGRLRNSGHTFDDGEYTVWLMQATNNTGNGEHPYGHMGAVELHMHRENGKWDEFVMVWTDFEWSYLASYDYTYSFAKLTNVVESGSTFKAHVTITLNRDMVISGALLSYDFSFSLDADRSDGPTSCVHTACDPCKQAGKHYGCPRSCSCLPQEGVPPPGVPGSFCGPCIDGTELVVVGNFSGTYDDCDTTIKCSRGRNDLQFAGNHQRLAGNVTLAPIFPLFKPLWPAQASGVKPVEPNEHPRLLFRKEDVQALKAAASTTTGQEYRKRLDASLQTNFSVWQAAGYCLRYVLTGSMTDARAGASSATKVAQGSPDTLDPRYGLKLTPLRVGPTMWALGLAYDLCHDAWSKATRQTVADSLLDLATRVSMMDSGLGCVPDKPASPPPPRPCNGEPPEQCVPYNHFCHMAQPKENHTGPVPPPVFAAGKIGRCGNHLGAVTGGGLMGLLAVFGDDTTDHSKRCNSSCLETAVKWSIGVLRMHLTIDWGDHGACTTDIGPEHVSANTGVLPVLQSLRTAMALDFFSADARASWILPWWTVVMVANPSGPSADFVHRGTYEPDQPWDGDNEISTVAEWSHQLSFLLGMGVLNASGNSSALGASLWIWNHYIEDSANSTLTKTYGMGLSPSSAAPMYGLVNWPELHGVDEVNPESVFGLNIVDEFQSYFVLRNRFQDSDDSMVTFMPGGRGGKRGTVGGSACYPQLGGLTAWGLGLRYSAVSGGSKYGARDAMPDKASAATQAFLAALGQDKIKHGSSALSLAKREVYRQLFPQGGGVLSFADDQNSILWSFGVDYSGHSGAALVLVLTSSAGNSSLSSALLTESREPSRQPVTGISAHTARRSQPEGRCSTGPEPAAGNVTMVTSAKQIWFVLTIQCGPPPPISAKNGAVLIGEQTVSFTGHPGHVMFGSHQAQLKTDDADTHTVMSQHVFRMGYYPDDGVRIGSCALDPHGHMLFVGYSRQNVIENVTVAAITNGNVVWLKPVPERALSSSSATATGHGALSAVTVYSPRIEGNETNQSASGPWVEIDRWQDNSTTSAVPDSTSKVLGFADSEFFHHGDLPQIAVSDDGATTFVALPINVSTSGGAMVRLFMYSGASTSSTTVDVLTFDRSQPRIALRIDAKATTALIVHAAKVCVVDLGSLKSVCELPKASLRTVKSTLDRVQDVPPAPIRTWPSVALAPGGQFIALSTAAGSITVTKRDLQSGQFSKYGDVQPPSRGFAATAAAFGDDFLVVGYSPAAVSVYDLSQQMVNWTYTFPSLGSFPSQGWAVDAVTDIAVAGNHFATASLGTQAKQVPTGHMFSVSHSKPLGALNTWGSMTCTDIAVLDTGDVVSSLAGMHQPAFVDDSSTDIYRWAVNPRRPLPPPPPPPPPPPKQLNVSAAGHPRILLGKDGVSALRTKVKSEPYSSWVEFLRNKTAESSSNHSHKKICLGYACPGIARAFDLAALHMLTGDDADACTTALEIVMLHLPAIPCEDRPVGNQPGCHKFGGFGSDGGHYQCSHLDGPAWSRRKIPLIYDFCADVWAAVNPENTTWVNRNLFWASLASSYAMSPACGPTGRMRIKEGGGGSSGGVNYCDSTNEPENFWGAIPPGLFACDGFDRSGSGSNSSSEIVANLFKQDVRFDPFNMSGNADALGAIHNCSFSWCAAPGDFCPVQNPSRRRGCPGKTAIANVVQWVERQIGSGGGWDVQDTGAGTGEGRDIMWAFVGPAMLAAKRLLSVDLRELVPGTVPALIGMFRATIGTQYQPDFGISDWSVDSQALQERSADGEGDLVRNYAFAAVRDEFENNSDLAAMRWVYDRTYPPQSVHNGNILSLLYHPADVVPRDPMEVWGNHWHDSRSGFSMFRSGYSMNFTEDVVAATIARSTPEWGQFLRSPTDTQKSMRTPDVNCIRIGGLGGVWLHGPGPVTTLKKTIHHSANPKNTSTELASSLRAYSGLFPSEPANDSTIRAGTCIPGWEPKPPTVMPHGGYSVISGSCFNTSNHTRRFFTDYSGRSGAPAAYLVADSSANGRVWRQFLKCGYTVAEDGKGAVIVTNPATGSSLRMQVMWPKPSLVKLLLDAVTPYKGTTDVKTDGSAHEFNGCKGVKDFPQARPLASWTDSSDSAGQWLVAMTLVRNGSLHPAVTSTGTGCCQQTVTMGTMSVKVVNDDFIVTDVRTGLKTDERTDGSALLLSLSHEQQDGSRPQGNDDKDLRVSLGTYLGDQTSQMAPVAVAALNDGGAVVVGNGRFLFGRTADVLIQGSNGTLVVIDKTSAVTALARVGNRLDDVALNAKKLVVVSGDFGVLLADASQTPLKAVWHDPIESPGVADIDSEGGEVATRSHVGISADGATVASAWSKKGHQTGCILSVHDGDGALLGRLNKTGVICSDVTLDADGATIYFSFYYVTHTGKEPIIMPAMHAYSKTLEPKWTDYDWDAHKLRPPDPKAVRCAGEVADSRVLAISAGTKDSVLFCGHSDGGDSMYTCEPNDLNKSAPFGTVLPGPWSKPYDISAQSVSYLAAMDAATGDVINSTFNLARLSSGRGNTIESEGITSDSAGFIYVIQTSTCCIEDRHNATMTINGEPVADYGGADLTLLIIKPDWSGHRSWTAFAHGPNSSATAVDVSSSPNGDTVAVVATVQAGGLYTKQPVVGTAKPSNSQPGGYLAIMPAVGPAAAKTDDEQTIDSAPGRRAIQTTNITNPNARGYVSELVRLPNIIVQPTEHVVDVQWSTTSSGPWATMEFQTDGQDVWLMITISNATTVFFEVTSTHSRRPLSNSPSSGFVHQDGDKFVLNNGLISVQLPAQRGVTTDPPAPVLSIDGRGSAAWSGLAGNCAKLLSFVAHTAANGPLFARVVLHYAFAADNNVTIAFTIRKNHSDVLVEEDYDMSSDPCGVSAGWNLSLAATWHPNTAILAGYATPWSNCSGITPPNTAENQAWYPYEWPLQPCNSYLGDRFGYFYPRWNQKSVAKWLYAVRDLQHIVGVMAARISKWRWPLAHNTCFDNTCHHKVATLFSDGSVNLPLFNGSRHYYLFSMANPEVASVSTPTSASIINPAPTPLQATFVDMQRRLGFAPLDKLVNEYQLDWPGLPDNASKTCGHKCGFQPIDFFSFQAANPTDVHRQMGKQLLARAQAGQLPRADLQTLAQVNTFFDPDFYGAYFGFNSPENPNFSTDFLRVPQLLALGLKTHPRWEFWRDLTVQSIVMDYAHAITLPSGAPQECPGYMGYALRDNWLPMAAILKEYFGYDAIALSNRLRAAVKYHFHTSQPFAAHFIGADNASAPGEWRGRFVLPVGDTHPKTDVKYELFHELSGVALPSLTSMVSEEMIGDVVILRNRAGTMSESFVSFKAGPNRGHRHGDQLSIHYCGYGARHAIDIMTGYKPEPEQEHLHSRMIVGEWENLDSFEKAVAFKTSTIADVAVGELSSDRLRQVPWLPPSGYNLPVPEPTRAIGAPAVYRRTVLLVKSGHAECRDYLVLRDQFWSPQPLRARLSTVFEQEGLSQIFHVNGPHVADLWNSTLFVAVYSGRSTGAEDPAWNTSRWKFASEGMENATIVYAESKSPPGKYTEYVSVIYPAGSSSDPDVPIPSMAPTAVDTGVVVRCGGEEDEIAFAVAGDTPDAHTVLPDSPEVSLRQGRTTHTLLQQSDIDRHRPQGDVGLYVIDSDRFGELPAWLVRERDTLNPTYPWPPSKRMKSDDEVV